MTRPIYLDHAATTPLDPRALEALLPYLREDFGNPSSRSHVFGWRAEEAVEKARQEVAALLGARPEELVWTSGATESDNLAVKGALQAGAARGRHAVTTRIEHKAVLDAFRAAARQGVEVTWIAPRPDGRVDPDEVLDAVRDDTVLVSVMHANNETGAVQPVEEIGPRVRARGALFHVDAAQSAGKVPLDVEAAGADLVSLSAHKLHGPKGVGALWVRRRPRVRLAALLDGGGQERGRRPGTLNVPGIVGFGAAAALALQGGAAESERVAALRDRLLRGLAERLGGVSENGSAAHRLPGLLNVTIEGVESDRLLAAVPEVAFSSGSACTSASLEPSYVLRAMGLPPDRAVASVRLSLGRFTTAEEVDRAVVLLAAGVQKLRS